MLSLATLFVVALSLVAQDSSSTVLSPECLGFGALISLLVSMLKGIPFIKKNPKTVSAVLSILWVAIPAFIKGGADFKVIAFCVIAQFTASVATFEAVTKPGKTLIAKDPN